MNGAIELGAETLNVFAALADDRTGGARGDEQAQLAGVVVWAWRIQESRHDENRTDAKAFKR